MIDFNRDFTKDLIWQEDNDVHFRATGIYYPSELTFPCPRNHVLRYLYPDKKHVEAEVLRKFQHGLLLEDWFIGCLKRSRSWEVFGTQESVGYKQGNIFFMGRRDVRAYNHHVRREFSIEVKKAALNWNYYPKQENLLQANFYLQGKPSNGLLVYVNPFLEIKHYPHSFNKPQFQEVINRGVSCHNHLENKTLPSREPHHWNGRVCDYCLFEEECKKA